MKNFRTYKFISMVKLIRVSPQSNIPSIIYCHPKMNSHKTFVRFYRLQVCRTRNIGSNMRIDGNI